MSSKAWIHDVGMYARFAAGLPEFFRQRVGLEQAKATIRERLEGREARFLELAERAVYGFADSPYLPLLRQAGCELGDLRSMVADRGLEATLLELRKAGVYVGFEEFKGRAPLSTGGNGRAGRHTFDNPFMARRLEGSSGGSTGPATRVPYDLNATLSRIPSYVVGCAAHDVLDAPSGIWRFGLPSMTGITNALRSVVIGNPIRRWFMPDGKGDLSPALRFRVATAFVVRASRLLGQPIPNPEPVPLDRADVVARWAADVARLEGKCLVRASVSMAMRVALAAEAEGIDLRGVALMGGSEPITVTKYRAITRSGARQIPTYTCSEAGPVGIGCANPIEENDLHFLGDLLALIQYPHRVPGTEMDVDAFCLTTLNPSAPMILLNVEIDDFGIVEKRACGCPLEDAGFGVHLRKVRSYRKLTGEGVTLIGSDMVRILEEVLPSKFGGHAHDYQLHQLEDSEGFTRLILVVDPQVRLPSEDAARRVILENLAGRTGMEDFARSLWQMAGTLRVERRPPDWTQRGKYPSLVVRRG